MPNPLVDDLTSIVEADFALPRDRPLAEVTADLLHALGDPDPVLRDELALPVLATWVERGVYDERLTALGDDLAAGLRSGLGEDGTPSVVQRSFYALVLAECVARDTDAGCVPREVVLGWSSALQAWFLAEVDLRGWVPDLGWAHALAHGADALGVLAGSPHLGATRSSGCSTSCSSGSADRATGCSSTRSRTGWRPRCSTCSTATWSASTTSHRASPGSAPQRASAASTAPRRARPAPRSTSPPAPRRRSCAVLHLQAALGAHRPSVRDDLLRLLVDALRASNPHYLPAAAPGLA